MASSSSAISRSLRIAAYAFAAYSIFLGSLTWPAIGRIALYANQFNTFWEDLNYPDQYGFSDGQVTPFTLSTPDGQKLYAWHVLPLDAYARHETKLRTATRHKHPVEDFTSTLQFQLLTEKSDPPPRVVISFHGNAGHIAQGWRTNTYRSLSIHERLHILTIDYRGFGRSTGYPTEAGLIADGTALANWVMEVAGIPAERIVLLGQSLGTAVSAGVALNFADPTSDLTPRLNSTSPSISTSALTRQVKTPTTFAGVVLVAPFSRLPSLLLTYRMGGIFPLFWALAPFPRFAQYVANFAPDTWDTAARLKEYRRILSSNPKLLESQSDDLSIKHPLHREMGAIQILHALNDVDISYHQTEFICREVVGPDEDCIDGSNGPALFEVKKTGEPRFRFELYPFGGHNQIVDFSPTALCIVRAFAGFNPR